MLVLIGEERKKCYVVWDSYFVCLKLNGNEEFVCVKEKD